MCVCSVHACVYVLDLLICAIHDFMAEWKAEKYEMNEVVSKRP